MAKLAQHIAPAVDRYNTAVFGLRSREAASKALAELAESIDALSGAAARGELHDFKSNALDQYWRLYTIFREPRYRGEAL